MSVRFDYNRHGGLTVDRGSLHESDGYKRQVEALKQLPERKAVMGENMTLADVRDWHRYVQQAEAANGRERSAHAHQQLADAIDAHLTQPAQAVDVGAIREVAEALCNTADGCERSKFPITGHRLRKCADKLTAALPKDSNGVEGVGHG